MVYGSNADNNLTVGAKELFWVQLFYGAQNETYIED